MQLFDTHTHLLDGRFDGDREELIASLPEKGVLGVIDCACTEEDWDRERSLSDEFPFVYYALGVHCHNALEAAQGWLSRLEEAVLADSKCVAVGEIGLDYHYDFAPRELQKEILRAQLELAVRLDKPVILHDREAHADMLEALLPFAGRLRGVLHCYSGSAEMIRQYAPLDLYFGVGGSLTFKTAEKTRAAARAMPLDRILLETDCPYLAPVPHRGERNDPTLTRLPCEMLAELRGVSPGEMAGIAYENARRLFGV